MSNSTLVSGADAHSSSVSASTLAVQADTLQDMAALTHVQRAAAICRRFGLRSFCVNFMLKLYRRHGITLGKAPPGVKDMAETHGMDEEAGGGGDGHDVR